VTRFATTSGARSTSSVAASSTRHSTHAATPLRTALPDAAAIAKVSVALGARGSVHTESYEMLEVDDLLSLLGS